MKALFKTLVAMVTVLTVTGAAFATTPFEGTIRFTKTVGPVTAEYVYYVKGNKIRVEELNEKGDIQGIMLVDTKDNTVHALSPERKLFIEVPNKREAREPEVTVEKTGNQKEINGYECQEVKVTSPSEGREVSYWVAKDGFDFFVPMLKTLNRKDKLAVYFLEVPELDGVFPIMGTEKKIGGVELTKLRVNNVEEKELATNMFEIPSNYSKFERE